MNDPTPHPAPPRPAAPQPPAPQPGAPRPGPAGGQDSRDMEEALARLDAVAPEDLDAVLEAAEQVHGRLRDRLGHAGGR